MEQEKKELFFIAGNLAQLTAKIKKAGKCYGSDFEDLEKFQKTLLDISSRMEADSGKEKRLALAKRLLKDLCTNYSDMNEEQINDNLEVIIYYLGA